MEGISLVETETLQALIGEVKGLRSVVMSTISELAEARKPYLTVNEAMEITGFGKTWLMANKQDIGYSSVGGCIRFKRKDVEAYMEQNYFKTKSSRRKIA
ncbi:Helix-turn-helix domain-containing protein [Mucilaginibacter lappiensis]|uniref:DNA-binding transcriptional regulator AlpA n=1 Tax=Mucilaginibacter lappiensis TaxID=354630 RepID=A0ABR6PJ19_9SPHI|nr:helix-turn-helix domain-containing protein [Mucilaginibacter lappiensis]MBB6109763.1 putative DNA-binding transcriptional regulator AlpA [Mucilaginibacter lappiensis]SIR14734.1 Helix-turn-helix domain-containing protein [Mucilaginibacter lappiensis]